MNEKNREDLIDEFISSRPSPKREAELEKLLVECGCDMGELRGLRETYLDFGEIRIPEPGEGMSGRFYAMLESEKAKMKESDPGRASFAARSGAVILGGSAAGSLRRLIPRFAYALFLILAGWTAAYWIPPGGGYGEKIGYMTTEMAEMKKMMMFSMLSRPSASERLQAVQFLRDIIDKDDQALTAMLEVFERDPNVNVRLATLDALSLVPRDGRVRESVIRNLSGQDSPIVQLALVELVVSMKDERAAQALKSLLERNDLNITVRSRASEGLRYLS